MSMNASLTTLDGFPRADVDVALSTIRPTTPGDKFMCTSALTFEK
jgi:hypothetical protein